MAPTPLPSALGKHANASALCNNYIGKSSNQLDSSMALAVSSVHTAYGHIRMYATQTAITHIKFYEDPIRDNPNHITELAKAQMQAYIAGTLQQFDLPLAPAGTPFQHCVWQQLLAVGYGHTASYLHVATAIGKPKACRAVGAANGKNPIAIVIPCHRVIGANGSLTGYAGGLARKSYLLSLES